MYNSKFNRNVLLLMLVITISKIIGMLRDSVLAYYFGTSSISDAYIVAMSVPMLLFYFVGHGISTSYIPMYSKIEKNQGEIEANKYTNSIINISLILSSLIIIILIIFSKPIIRVFALGFDQETLKLSANFVRISAISLIFIVFVDIYGAFLNIKGKFIIPAMRSIARNLIIVISIYFAYKYELYFLGIGVIFAYLSEFIFLFLFARKNNLHYKTKIYIKDPNVKHTFFLVAPIILSTGISQINKIIDKSIASTIAVGGISALSYASVINNAIQEILITGLIAVLFANFANLAASNKINEIRFGLTKTLDLLTFFLIPATIGIILLAKNIVRLFFLRGAFDIESLNMTTQSLIFYSIGLIFVATKSVFIKVYYAFNNTKTPTIIAIVSIFINIILNLVLSKFLGIPGLALATSISVIVNSLVLYYLLAKKINVKISKHSILVLTKTILSTVFMVVSILSVDKLLSNIESVLFDTLIKTSIGTIVFFVSSLIVRNSVLISFFNSDNKKGEQNG